MKRLVALAFALVLAGSVGAEEPPSVAGGGGRALSMPATPTLPREIVCLGTAATQAAVREGKARRFAEIGHGLDGEPLRADLCRADGTLLYRVTVLDRTGRVRNLGIDAATGRMLYDGR
jgi:hypothetical protein